MENLWHQYRVVLVLLFVCAFGCSRHEQASDLPGPAATMDRDSAVVEAVCRHYLTDTEITGFNVDNKRGVVLFHEDAPERGSFIEPQMLERYFGGDLPKDLTQALYERNATKSSFKDLQVPKEIIHVGDFTKLMTEAGWFDAIGGTGELHDEAIKAKGWMHAWAPAFSSDGKRALLITFIGPAPHSVIVAYVLGSDGGTWKVEDRRPVILP
jgi:hypothetical protein